MAHFLDGTTEDRPGLAVGLMLSGLMILAIQDALAGWQASTYHFGNSRPCGRPAM